MKKSIVQSLLLAAGLTITPTVMWAQSTPAAPPTPTGQNPASGQTNTTEQRGTEAPNPATPSPTNPTPVTPSATTASPSAQEQFRTLDINNDGLVSRDEFARFSDVDPHPARDASSSTGIGRNGTGPGTPGSTTGSTGGTTGKNNDAQREEVRNKSNDERFTELDVNLDGNLSLEEFDRARPSNIDAGRDASSSTGAGRNGTGPGTSGSTQGSTEGSTANPSGNNDKR